MELSICWHYQAQLHIWTHWYYVFSLLSETGEICLKTDNRSSSSVLCDSGSTQSFCVQNINAKCKWGNGEASIWNLINSVKVMPPLFLERTFRSNYATESKQTLIFQAVLKTQLQQWPFFKKTFSNRKTTGGWVAFYDTYSLSINDVTGEQEINEAGAHVWPLTDCIH